MFIYGIIYPIVLVLGKVLATQLNPLPSGLPILELRYPNTPWVFPGETLSMSDTHSLPQISSWGLQLNTTYLMVFVDLDVLYGETSTVILHWYQPDMVIDDTNNPWLEPGGNRKDRNNKHTAAYIAPQPPPGSHHRYVYLAFEQHEEYMFPGCFGHIFPKTVEARAGFDLRQFVEVSGLKHPVSGNYFFVNNDEIVTGTLTSTMSSPSPTTTWVRSAPCSQPVIKTATTQADDRKHVRGTQRRQTVM